MTATACLRVSLDANRTDVPVASLGPLVAKYATAFLEVRWCWPRQSMALTPYCYLLTDPRADRLDTTEIARMSEELELRLFGTAASEALTLLLFEGEEEAIAEFSTLSDEGVKEMMSGARPLPAGAQLSRIAPDGTLSPTPPDQPGLRRKLREDEPEPPPEEAVEGIYFPGRQVFVGDVLSCTPSGSDVHVSVVEGAAHLPPDVEEFDNGCVLAARRLIDQGKVKAPLYVPVCFSKLMRPTLRNGYAELLHILPASARPSLAAAVYDVPRAMSFQALKIVQATLDDHFGAIDLQTFDPGFEVLPLPVQAVRSVTLVLPDARPDARLAALRRFGGRASEFKRRQIWMGVTNLRTRKERDLALELRVPFMTGPAICGPRAEPLGGTPWAQGLLPAPAGDGVRGAAA